MRQLVNNTWVDVPVKTTNSCNSNFVASVGTEEVGIYMKKTVRRQLRENLESEKRKKEKK